MRIRGFDWNYNNLEHILRHNIQDYEAEEVLVSKKTIVSKSKNNIHIAFGVSENGRYLFVVFIRKWCGTIRVITARDMTEREKHNYKKKR